jgi:hypothetical protein
MDSLRTPIALLVMSMTSACASTAQSPGASGSSGNGTASGSSGTQASGATGGSGSATAGASGSSGSASGASTSGTSTSGASTSGATSSGSTSGSGGSDGGVSGLNASDAGSDAAGGQSCSNVTLCDGFESVTSGSPPNSAAWSLYGTRGCGGSGNPSAPVVFPIAVDNTQHNRGLQSLKVEGGDSCGAFAVNTSAFDALSAGEVYVRFNVMLDPTRVFAHAVLAAGGLLPVTDGGLGFTTDQSSYLELAPQTNGGTATDVFYWATTDNYALPQQNSAGAATTTYVSGTGFSCIEFHVSKTQRIIETWINGNAVPGLTSTSSGNSTWTPPPSLGVTSLGLGWLDFSGPPTPLFPVWFDDVAISSTRIGCSCACP